MQYLFERLANRQQDGRQPVSKEQLQLDVIRQLQCIVASRPWLGEEASPETHHLLGFGMAAVPELARDNPQQLERYGQRLKELIKHYEPRLQHPVISLAPSGDPASPLRIQVSGQLLMHDEDEEVVFVSMESTPQFN